MKYTVKEFAKEKGVTDSSARRLLNKMVEDGSAKCMSGVIIGYRSGKRGTRSKLAPVRGNEYEVL